MLGSACSTETIIFVPHCKLSTMYTFLTLILLILFLTHSSQYQSIEDMSISQISIVSFHLTFLTLHLLPYSKLS